LESTVTVTYLCSSSLDAAADCVHFCFEEKEEKKAKEREEQQQQPRKV